MMQRRAFVVGAGALLAGCAVTQVAATPRTRLTLKAGDRIADAIAKLPAEGGEIALSPGEYREKLTVDKANVSLIGLGAKPEDVLLAWSDGAKHVGGTGKSWSVSVTADNVHVTNLTIENDYSKKNPTDRTQAVAILATGDKLIFDRVRFLGAQDTLYAASKGCRGDGCLRPAQRQYYRDCYVEGEVDFIFGDAKAFFDNCHIHGIKYPVVMYTAQSKVDPKQDSAYVFQGCRFTADPGAGSVWLGRPWRKYSAVVMLDCEMPEALAPAGWREWAPGQTDYLPLVTYAEYNSKGPGARPSQRDPHSKQLTATEAARYRLPALFPDWDPRKS